ncbi:19716_t:CDS:2 [Cetraspora pellucida]|uniref:19716_t:CDS:1 n=1 Tax=Cetraspora pellucida TaxID=1433469 RepID=A0A9N9BBZ4_9GLOM|nr:19716_t:CDS:2 [Cetraspora pellucida]
MISNSFHVLVRALSCLVLIFDAFSSSPLFRESIYAFSWIPGFISLHWYLHGIIVIIPKIRFDCQPVNSSGFRKMIIPQEEQVRILTWITILLTILCISIPSIFAAHFRENYNSLNDLKEARRTQIIFLWLSCLLVLVLIVYYGRAVVTLTKESLRITLVEDDQWMKQMEAYNWVCGIVFFFWSIALIPPIINYDIMEQKVASTIYSFFSNDATPVFFGFLIYTIIKETSINTPTSESYDEHISTWFQSGNENTVLIQLSPNNLKHDSINTSELCYSTNIHVTNSLRSQSGTEEYQDTNTSNTITDSNQNNLAETDEHQDTNTSDNIIDSNQDNLEGTDKQQDTNTSDNIIDSNQDNLEGMDKQQDINTSDNTIDSNQDNLEGINKQQDTNTSDNIIDSIQDNLEETDKQQDNLKETDKQQDNNTNQDNLKETYEHKDTNTT